MAEISKKNKPVVLIILDGWGVAPASQGNAISLAKTPNFTQLINLYPSGTIQAAGFAVGLPWGQDGNSEVGHLNLGAGRIIYQTLPKIDKAITDGEFFTNPVLLKIISEVKKNKSSLHLLGLISSGTIHASREHLYALLELIKKEKLSKVYLHAILDGRDSPYNSGLRLIKEVEFKMNQLNVGQLATLSGRFYAMDRDLHWERTEKAYLALTEGQSKKYFSSALEAIQDSYQQKIFDEEFLPTVIIQNNQPVAKIKEGDAVIFFNFRTDRARQLTKAFVDLSFEKFNRPRFIQNLIFATMTEYESGLPTEVIFPSEKINYPLARVLSEAGLRQLHIAETEKYAHVTYFFNGGQEKPFPKEDRILIPSPRVSSYDQKPEMSAPEVARAVILGLIYEKYDFIVVNFANPDMVGHTGNLSAAIQTIEILDKLIGEIVDETLKKDGRVIITADHGNIEEMVNLRTGEIDKKHSSNPVPFIFVEKGKGVSANFSTQEKDLSTLTPMGVLADVTPTILKAFNLKVPTEMNGRPII